MDSTIEPRAYDLVLESDDRATQLSLRVVNPQCKCASRTSIKMIRRWNSVKSEEGATPLFPKISGDSVKLSFRQTVQVTF